MRMSKAVDRICGGASRETEVRGVLDVAHHRSVVSRSQATAHVLHDHLPGGNTAWSWSGDWYSTAANATEMGGDDVAI